MSESKWSEAETVAGKAEAMVGGAVIAAATLQSYEPEGYGEAKIGATILVLLVALVTGGLYCLLAWVFPGAAVTLWVGENILWIGLGFLLTIVGVWAVRLLFDDGAMS